MKDHPKAEFFYHTLLSMLVSERGRVYRMGHVDPKRSSEFFEVGELVVKTKPTFHRASIGSTGLGFGLVTMSGVLFSPTHEEVLNLVEVKSLHDTPYATPASIRELITPLNEDSDKEVIVRW